MKALSSRTFAIQQVTFDDDGDWMFMRQEARDEDGNFAIGWYRATMTGFDWVSNHGEAQRLEDAYQKFVKGKA